MFNGISKCLVLAPHTDDGELGAGGTIVKLLEQNVEVHYAAFSTGEESLAELGLPIDQTRTEVKNATLKLGIPERNLHIFNHPVRKLNYVRQEILDILVRLKKEIAPDLVLMPCLRDIHQDHSTIATEGLRAFKQTTMLGYELIWNNLQFNTQCFMKLEAHHVEKKLEACVEYESQRFRGYMNREFIFALARTRGVQIGANYAEAFEVVRWVM